MSDIKRGEQWMKAVVKASLHALFDIGIKSPAVVDRFIISFTENFEKQMSLLNAPQEKVDLNKHIMDEQGKVGAEAVDQVTFEDKPKLLKKKKGKKK